MKKHPAKKLAALLLLSALASCSSAQQLAQPEAITINKANNMYARERFSEAADNYRRSVEENPDSPYRKQALLGLADALYKDKQYFEAVLYYERFLELYPLDTATPRAYFYYAMGYYSDTHTADRDQSNTVKATEALNRFLAKYPNHQLAPLARKMKGEMDVLIVDSRMEVARLYYRLEKNQAAIGRLKEFIEQNPGAKDAEEAMYMLGECYYREQNFREAAAIFTRLMEKYPAGEFSKTAAAVAGEIKIKGK
ncbi:MAG: outer membrane protein assembly factor BamD [Nitrospinae bacterium]|nr:outer membrane protein assembly factor BamD [Nitrospinota bacterium]